MGRSRSPPRRRRRRSSSDDMMAYRNKHPVDGPSHQKPTADKPGDWECGKCKFVNFLTRSECMKCHTQKRGD
eukprot:gene30558-62728_t